MFYYKTINPQHIKRVTNIYTDVLTAPPAEITHTYSSIKECLDNMGSNKYHHIYRSLNHKRILKTEMFKFVLNKAQKELLSKDLLFKELKYDFSISRDRNLIIWISNDSQNLMRCINIYTSGQIALVGFGNEPVFISIKEAVAILKSEFKLSNFK